MSNTGLNSVIKRKERKNGREIKKQDERFSKEV